MPYPTLYDVTYSYSGFQQSQQGISAFPGTQLDADLAGLDTNIENLSTFMRSVIRSDGALNNGSVTYDSLSPSLQTAGLAPAVAWATGVSYLANVAVLQNGSLYRCLVAHTAGVFATDLAAAKWLLVGSLPLPPPSPTTIGGVKSIAPVASNWLGSIGTDGTPTQSQPGFADILGVLTNAQLPTFTQAGIGAIARLITAKIGETFSVADFGVLGAVDDTPTFQKAVTACAAAAGGTVLVPAGAFAVANLSLPGNVVLRGAGKTATILQSWHTDANVVTLAGSSGGLEYLTIFGKGTNADTGALGATQNALTVNGVENVIRSVRVWGGNYAIYAPGTDNTFYDVNSAEGYGGANIATVGANWHIRCKYDHAPVGGVVDSVPFAAWAASTPYTVGKVRIVGAYALCCTVAGTSGAAAPTVSNYGISIIDGTVTWQLLAPISYDALLLGAGAAENHFLQCDFSGAGYTKSVDCQATGNPAVSDFVGCVFSAPISVSSGTAFALHGCELPRGGITINGGYTGRTVIDACYTVSGAVDITVGANVNDFIISDNFLNGGTILVTAGTSSRYRISNNPGATVVDNGTGTDRMPASFTNSLGAAVAMTAANTYYDGPSVAQGSVGTWLATGSVVVVGIAATDQIIAKLWDGTTLIDSGFAQPGGSLKASISLSGIIASPAGNIRISCDNVSSAAGNIAASNGIDTKASTISAVRIA